MGRRQRPSSLPQTARVPRIPVKRMVQIFNNGPHPSSRLVALDIERYAWEGQLVQYSVAYHLHERRVGCNDTMHDVDCDAKSIRIVHAAPLFEYAEFLG